MLAFDQPGPTPQASQVSLQRRLDADSWLFGLVCVCLSTYVVEGALRYVLNFAGRPNLIYFRDVVPVASIAFVFVRALVAERRIEAAIAVPLCILLAHACIGLANGLALFQILFGAKIFIGTIYGIALWPVVRVRAKWMYGLIWVFFLLTGLGISINAIVGQMPWEGQTYETAFGAVQASREWWAEGVRRLPGFARASFDAALIAGLCGVLIMASSARMLQRIVIAAAAIAVVILTTTKGMMLALSLASLWLLPPGRSTQLRSGRLLVVTLLVLACAVPTLVVIYDVGSLWSGKGLPGYLLSLWDRIQDMWPSAYRMLVSPMQLLLGIGVGGIGMPQTVSSSLTPLNAADNVFVYYYISFGLMSLLYLSVPAVLAARVCARELAPIPLVYLGVLIIAYGYGLTTNMAEQPFFSFFYGLAYGAALSHLWPRASDADQQAR